MFIFTSAWELWFDLLKNNDLLIELSKHIKISQCCFLEDPGHVLTQTVSRVTGWLVCKLGLSSQSFTLTFSCQALWFMTKLRGQRLRALILAGLCYCWWGEIHLHISEINLSCRNISRMPICCYISWAVPSYRHPIAEKGLQNVCFENNSSKPMIYVMICSASAQHNCIFF